MVFLCINVYSTGIETHDKKSIDFRGHHGVKESSMSRSKCFDDAGVKQSITTFYMLLQVGVVDRPKKTVLHLVGSMLHR